MTLKLKPPGDRNRVWYVRGSYNGREREFSTGTADEALARVFLDRLIEGLANLRGSEEERRQTPAAITLGAFERWVLAEFELIGELIYRRTPFTPVLFHGNGKGYRSAKISYDRWTKRILEHRMKFLLAHGWLPVTVDHTDRNRSNNLLSNLEASTPARQVANRTMPAARRGNSGE